MTVMSNTQPRHIMRLPEVITATGYKRSSIYLFMEQGSFPRCRRIGPRAVGWDSLEIEAWIRSKLGGQQ
jgi:prophage regulatory protein|nr:AlpA family phage regulatory protein [Pseudomonas asiatica]